MVLDDRSHLEALLAAIQDAVRDSGLEPELLELVGTTTPAQTRVLEDAYAQLAAEFAPEEIATLTLALLAADRWSRFQVHAASPDTAAVLDPLAGVPFN